MAIAVLILLLVTLTVTPQTGGPPLDPAMAHVVDAQARVKAGDFQGAAASMVPEIRTLLREYAPEAPLGAERSSVRRMVVVQGGRVVLLGVALGFVVALGVTGVLKSLLFGVDAFDAVTFIAMWGVMLAVALLASYIPAYRASSVDPMVKPDARRIGITASSSAWRPSSNWSPLHRISLPARPAGRRLPSASR